MEAAVLAGLVLISGALTAVLTAVSAFPQPLARHGFGVLLIVYACTLGGGSLIRMAQGFSSPTQLIPILITLIIWATLFSLWHAAASIAPAALNLTLPRRLTSLAALLIAAGMVFLSYDAAPILLTILVATSMVEMGDRPSAHPGVGAAFARRGPAGKAAALLFHPGWATGVVFCAGLWLLAWRLLPGSGFAGDFASAAALCFFPICAGAPLLARQRSGTVMMMVLAAAAHILSLLAEALLPGELKSLSLILPSVRGHDFSPFVAGFWIALALVISTRPLAVMLRRISRESNL